MSCGAGGVFFEYILNSGSLIEFSIPINLMAGGINIYEYNTKTEIESSAFFIIEPGISIDINVSDNYTQSLFISYRLPLIFNIKGPLNFEAPSISDMESNTVSKWCRERPAGLE